MKALRIVSIVLMVIGGILFAGSIPIMAFIAPPIGLLSGWVISGGGFFLLFIGMIMMSVSQSRSREAGRAYSGSEGPIGGLPPIPTAIAGKKCPRCGESVEAGDLYCGRCGYRLDGHEDEDQKL